MCNPIRGLISGALNVEILGASFIRLIGAPPRQFCAPGGSPWSTWTAAPPTSSLDAPEWSPPSTYLRLISSLRNSNLPTSAWKRVPQLRTEASRTAKAWTTSRSWGEWILCLRIGPAKYSPDSRQEMSSVHRCWFIQTLICRCQLCQKGF